MDKNDKLKEELAEDRHNQIMVLRLLTVGFGALAVVASYGAWQGTGGWFIFMLVFAIVDFVALAVLAYCHMQKRYNKIKQLDNQEESQMPDNSTKEPTLKDIMNELKKAELRNRVMAWLVLGSVSAGLVFAGVAVVFKTGWLMIIVGLVFFTIGCLGVWRKWPPGW